MKFMTLESRIARKLTLDWESGCWLWIGAIGSHGYGQVRNNNGTTVVHKILFERQNGPVPNGFELDHLCRVRGCVNPEHLEVVTRRENILRGVGPPAIQMRQTHCKQGHPLFGENLRVDKTKWGTMRRCRICTNEISRRSYRKMHPR